MPVAAATEELHLIREFAAPRERLYAAFTEPDLIAAWFGPVGFSVPRNSVDIDVREGGHQRFTMVNDEDPSWISPVDATFTAVVPGELLEGAEEFEGVPQLQAPTTMTARFAFEDAGDGGSRLVITQGPYTEKLLDLARQGWESSFSKLEALLAG
jgi:uncharacterized protein YndB with AHSA1/START domain